MTQDQFTNAIDGLVNDFENAIIDGKGLRDGICDTVITLVGDAERARPKTLEQLEAERLAWSLEVFTEATPISSLRKLEGEMKEVEVDLSLGNDPTEEYVDCLMCLLDSAGRAGITMEQLRDGFAKKLAKNKARTWSKNPDNSYSHVKS